MANFTQGVPKHISQEDFDRDWPFASLKVIRDGVAVEKSGRVVGRTIAGVPKYDLILDDRTIVSNVAASEVTILPRAVVQVQ